MLDSKDSKYIIGIDLGTTNSALSYFDTALAEEDERIVTQAIPQLVNPGEVGELGVIDGHVTTDSRCHVPSGARRRPFPEPSPGSPRERGWPP